jgi:hypothetical protein
MAGRWIGLAKSKFIWNSEILLMEKCLFLCDVELCELYSKYSKKELENLSKNDDMDSEALLHVTQENMPIRVAS